MKRVLERSPRFGLIRGTRGWYKYIPGVGTKYVCSDRAADTGAIADEVYQAKFPELTQIRRVAVGAMTARDGLDLWLADREAAGLSPHTFKFYVGVVDLFCDTVKGDKLPLTAVGRTQALAYKAAIAHLAASSRKNRLVYIKTAFRWLIREGHVMKEFWGDAWDVPTKAEHRKDHATQVATRGIRLYEPDEIRTLLKSAPMEPLPLKLWIMLGINGALGQSDLDAMTRHHVRSDRLHFPRVKTGVDRIVPLWPETSAMLRDWIKSLPKDRDKLFTSKTGRDLHGAAQLNVVTKAFTNLCEATSVPAHGFYSLRRTFRTMTDTLNRHAVDLVMGHESNDVGRRYVQSIDFSRLVEVTDHVHRLIFAPPARKSSESSRRSTAAAAEPRGSR